MGAFLVWVALGWTPMLGPPHVEAWSSTLDDCVTEANDKNIATRKTGKPQKKSAPEEGRQYFCLVPVAPV